MRLTSGDLVGREPELARLEAALDDPREGARPLFEIVGEPGIGKSRLLAEIARRADARRYLVFSGRAGELEHEPFGVFVDALDPFLAALHPARFKSLSEEQRQELAGVFPSLSELEEEPPGVLQHERYRTHYAVRGLLELLASDRPCLLSLDDMHWADPASLELIAHLLRRRPEAPVLIALAFRPAQAPRGLLATLSAAEREQAAERIELSSLSRAEADALLDPALEPALRDRLYQESGGNPFYLEQLARGARARRSEAGGSAVPTERAAASTVPAPVREALAAELGALPEGSLLVLRGAAVVGDPFSSDLATHAADVSAEETMTAIDELLERDLIRATPSPLDFRFRHPIVRLAVYEGIPAGWLAAAHSRAGAAILARDSPPAAAAQHVERSATVGDDEAIALLTEAGHATAPRAPASAARWFDAALRLLPGREEDPRRLELLVPMARALGASGQLEASRVALAEVLELVPPELAAVRGQVIAFMSLVDHLLGRHGEARATLERALEQLPAGPSSDSAALQAELAADCFFLGEWERMREWASRAREVASEVGDARSRAAAAALLGLAHYELTEVAAAREAVSEAKAIIDSLSDDELALRVDACHWLGWTEHLIDHYQDSIEHMTRGIEISRQTGQGHVLAPMTIGLVIANTWQGRLDEAARLAEEAVEMAHLAGSDQLLAWALTMRCWVAGRLGDLEEAIRAGEGAVRVAAGVTRGPYTVVAACWLADARLQAGDPAHARRDLASALGDAELAGVEPAFRSCIYELLTRIELALGRLEEADEWAGRAEEAVAGLGLPGRASFALRARAEVALARGEAETAAGLALEAAAAAGSGYRVEAGRARVLAGRALAAAGEEDRARVELRQALSRLEECGAARFREEAARELRRLGEHVSRPGGRGRAEAGIESLSERELEVARLVTERLTNRQIAERLVLSEKTVERHLSRIFRKLGVSSRVDVARAVEEADARVTA